MEVRLIAVTRFLAGGGTPEELIEHAGRVCWASEPHGDPAPFIRRLVERGHESVLEHASVSFEISGISRACSHQLVRHRIASYSQQSQRFVDMSEAEFVIPPAIAEKPEAMAIWNETLAQARSAYLRLREAGIKKEDSRFLLPQATTTRLVVTMNFRELRHFFRVRCDRAAQWEIRAVASEMLRQAYLLAPAVFQDLYAEFIAGNSDGTAGA